MTVIVVGAGCFGAWTAFHLARSGHDVTLLDAYGPGNSRASSGGETRVIRMGYGAQEIYTRWSWRSLALWKALFERTDPTLFHETGVLWMARDEDSLTDATLATLEHLAVPHERLSRAQLESRWPQIDFGAARGSVRLQADRDPEPVQDVTWARGSVRLQADHDPEPVKDVTSARGSVRLQADRDPEPAKAVTWAIHEPRSGVLMARRAVEAVVREAQREGVRYVAAAAQPPAIGRGPIDAITTQSGETMSAATFVFACGPWLPKLFTDLLGDRIFATRQEVLYFGPPPGDRRFSPPAMPAWIDFGEEMYGIPDIEARGFKISLDRHGPPFDPDNGDRVAGQTFDAVRAYLARRFPALRDAPIVAAEVCQYENSCNGDFLIDRHPERENVWLVGGGSGHGFKHGPAVGEYVARLVADGGEVDERFSLATKEKIQKRAVY